MNPTDLYHQQVISKHVEPDANQEAVLKVFDRLYEALQNPPKVFWPFGKKQSPDGVYLYGKVGRGKTYLMDLFYETLTIPKVRAHFYEFMAGVHVELKMAEGQVNPLQRVVESLAKKAKILCLDEFFVEDIADAMILAALLDGLFKVGVVVVTTSNVAPKDLYKEGLQRDRFLPSIALIEKNMQVLSLDHPTDYRLIHDFKGKNYHSPLDRQQEFLEFHFNQLQGAHALLEPHFVLNDWGFVAVCRTAKTIWFDFNELCVRPRSSLDYLALSETYNAILLQNVPALGDSDNDAVRRFITLVDTCYDRHVALIVAAAAPLLELYQGKRLEFEFERTKSRLIEMAGWI